MRCYRSGRSSDAEKFVDDEECKSVVFGEKRRRKRLQRGFYTGSRMLNR